MASYKFVYSDDYLSHHGIKGQKWGVRRFQNEDGSLTEAGKKRYYKVEGKSSRIYTLSDEGLEYNKLQKAQITSAANAILLNMKRVKKKEYEEALADWKEANKANNLHYLQQREMWLNNEGKYRNVSWDKFKDISADDWYTNHKLEAEKEKKSSDKVKKLLEEAMKEHPWYSKTNLNILKRSIYINEDETPIDILNEFHMDTVNLGKEATATAFAKVWDEVVSEQKHSLKDTR